MKSQRIIKKFPDVKVQQFETKFIFSSQEVIDTIVPALDFLGYGLIYYEKSECNITVYTSDKMKTFLDKMEPGFQVTDPNTGETGTVVSDKFIVCGNYCVRVQFPSGTDVYDFDFFVE